MTPTTNRRTKKANAEEHSAAQRLRILSAARQRFIEQGFHAATMESIAQLAGVSTGLSYRYFQNKRALILALIEQNLVEERRGLESLSPLESPTRFVDELSEAFRHQGGEVWSAVLFSEITVASARDPEIGEVLEQADAVARDDFIGWLEARDKAMARDSSDEDRRVRALMLRCLYSGLIVRSTREPDLDIDLLKAMLGRVLSMVMPEEQG